MKRRFVPFCLALLICSCGGQGEVWTESELGTEAEIKDIFFADSLNGWMVGGSPFVEGGITGRTRDGGDTWEFQSGIVGKLPRVFLFHINAVEFIDATTGCAVTTGGVILRSGDAGATWDLVRRGGTATHLFDLDFADERHGWAVGLAGVLHTDDGGMNWRRLDGDPRVTARAVHFVDQWRGWAVGQHGKVLRTGDGGHHWVPVEVPLPADKPHFFALDFEEDTHGWIVGEDGVIIATTDGGLTWDRQSSLVGAFLTSVCFADTLRGWVTGFTRSNGMSQILHTEDGGLNWIVEKRVEGQELYTIDIVGNNGWAVGKRVRPTPQTLLRMNASRRN